MEKKKRSWNVRPGFGDLFIDGKKKQASDRGVSKDLEEAAIGRGNN